MADNSLNINIATSVQLAELQRLEASLQRQIITAQVMGKEFKSLEANLMGVRAAMATIPAMANEIKQKYDLAGESARKFAQFQKEISSTGGGGLPKGFAGVGGGGGFGGGGMEISNRHAFNLVRSFEHLGATGKMSMRHLAQETSLLSEIMSGAGISGVAAFTGIGLAAVAAGAIIHKSTELSKEADEAWKEAGVGAQGYFKNLLIGYGLLRSPEISGFINQTKIAEGSKLGDVLKARRERIYHEETPEEAGLRAVAPKIEKRLQLSKQLDEANKREETFSKYGNKYSASVEDAQEEAAILRKEIARLNKEIGEESRAAADEAADKPLRREAKLKEIENTRQQELANLKKVSAEQAAAGTPISDAALLEKTQTIEKTAREKTQEVKRQQLEEAVITAPDGARQAKQNALERFNADAEATNKAASISDEAARKDLQNKKAIASEADKSAAKILAAKEQERSASGLRSKIDAENKVYETDKEQRQKAIKKAEAAGDPTEKLKAEQQAEDSAHKRRLAQISLEDATKKASVAEQLAGIELISAEQSKNLDLVHAAEDKILAAQKAKIDAEIAFAKATGQSVDGLQAQKDLLVAHAQAKREGESREILQAQEAYKANVYGAEYGLSKSFLNRNKLKDQLKEQIEEVHGRKGEKAAWGGGRELEEIGLIQELAGIDPKAAKRLAREHGFTGKKLAELGEARDKAQAEADKLKADAIGTAVAKQMRAGAPIPVKEANPQGAKAG